MIRPRYRRKCRECRIKVLNKWELLHNIDLCDDCVALVLERAERERLARKLGKDASQLEDDLPDFDPELHT